MNYWPTLRAKLALLRSNPEQALEVLRAAAPYELGEPSFSLYNWPDLYPVYVRGEAYLAARKGSEAAAEFRKILDHRGIVLNEPIGALAHLQLGRAYALQGDTAKSHNRPPDRLGLRHIREYQAELFQKRKLSPGSVANRLAALRFFYIKRTPEGLDCICKRAIACWLL
jgi:hypothetical protein